MNKSWISCVVFTLVVLAIGMPCLMYFMVHDRRSFNFQQPRQPRDEYTLYSHDERIKHIRDTCLSQNLISNRFDSGKRTANYYYSEKYDFACCKVPKSGCTFISQMILFLNGYTTKDIFTSPRQNIHHKTGKIKISSEMLRLTRTRAILVARDPFSRLYSGYIDKIFLGNKADYRQKIRSNSTDECNFGITFEEFLQFIIKQARSNLTLDGHWAPIFDLCSPCDVNQFWLIKQETFSNNVELILQDLNIKEYEYEIISDALYDHRAEATIPGIIETLYSKTSTAKNVLNCIGLSGVAKRLWRSFQIQGFIDKNIDFPWSDFRNEKDLANYTKLSRVILETIKRYPLTAKTSKDQRLEALVSAYASVSKEAIDGIKDVYRLDFQLFDYDYNPPSFK